MGFPTVEHLNELDMMIVQGDEPWIHSTVLASQHGDEVSLIWDEAARSVNITWMRDTDMRMRLYRESVSDFLLDTNGRVSSIHVTCEREDLLSELTVIIGETVSVTDSLLER